MNVLANDGISEIGVQILEENGFEVITEKVNQENLITEINQLNNKISILNNKIFSQKQKINQFNLDTQELEFLKLNLEYGHKCRKSFLNTDGFNLGTEGYKSCVLNKGRIDG